MYRIFLIILTAFILTSFLLHIFHPQNLNIYTLELCRYQVNVLIQDVRGTKINIIFGTNVAIVLL